MSGFQRGDYIFNHAGKAVFLRLTLGGLAEMFSQESINTISDLSACIRAADEMDIINIFSILSRPVHADTIEFSDLNIETALPVLADIFEMAFAPLSDQEAL